MYVTFMIFVVLVLTCSQVDESNTSKSSEDVKEGSDWVNSLPKEFNPSDWESGELIVNKGALTGFWIVDRIRPNRSIPEEDMRIQFSEKELHFVASSLSYPTTPLRYAVHPTLGGGRFGGLFAPGEITLRRVDGSVIRIFLTQDGLSIGYPSHTMQNAVFSPAIAEFIGGVYQRESGLEFPPSYLKLMSGENEIIRQRKSYLTWLIKEGVLPGSESASSSGEPVNE